MKHLVAPLLLTLSFNAFTFSNSLSNFNPEVVAPACEAARFKKGDLGFQVTDSSGTPLASFEVVIEIDGRKSSF